MCFQRSLIMVKLLSRYVLIKILFLSGIFRSGKTAAKGQRQKGFDLLWLCTSVCSSGYQSPTYHNSPFIPPFPPCHPHPPGLGPLLPRPQLHYTGSLFVSDRSFIYTTMQWSSTTCRSKITPLWRWYKK